ncbi:hypothetical protein MJ579_03490 [Klebsiella pneumoniae]|nr:hypothetical protein MJ579_03490 [Klebsiella pneumoniae]
MIPAQWKPSASIDQAHVKGRNNCLESSRAVETAKETLAQLRPAEDQRSEPRRPLRGSNSLTLPTRRELTSGRRHSAWPGVAAGIKAAKDLGNMPPNICNAAYLASRRVN